MKYLKTYNESKSRKFGFMAKPEEGELDELKDFCETNLAYLVDEDFVVEVSNDYTHKNFHISILKEGSKYKGFTWEEVKDYFIPFLTHLSRKYSICYEQVMLSPLVNGIPTTYTSYNVDRIISKDDFSVLPFSSEIPKSAWLQLYPISEISIDIEYKMNLED
jgi:hypothetical protein